MKEGGEGDCPGARHRTRAAHTCWRPILGGRPSTTLPSRVHASAPGPPSLRRGASTNSHARGGRQSNGAPDPPNVDVLRTSSSLTSRFLPERQGGHSPAREAAQQHARRRRV
ncbi:unnamed protein product [Prorocentrum cordatum]|uniref:Uncharacterized protein n=1 Tax=Prorocentrum cordatum TaxID=2364126 RepID=A0ABN9PBF3_9DINO|nr:unnamed protein product [Polarella glacialis]